MVEPTRALSSHTAESSFETQTEQLEQLELKIDRLRQVLMEKVEEREVDPDVVQRLHQEISKLSQDLEKIDQAIFGSRKPSPRPSLLARTAAVFDPNPTSEYIRDPKTGKIWSAREHLMLNERDEKAFSDRFLVKNRYFIIRGPKSSIQKNIWFRLNEMCAKISSMLNANYGDKCTALFFLRGEFESYFPFTDSTKQHSCHLSKQRLLVIKLPSNSISPDNPSSALRKLEENTKDMLVASFGHSQKELEEDFDLSSSIHFDGPTPYLDISFRLGISIRFQIESEKKDLDPNPEAYHLEYSLNDRLNNVRSTIMRSINGDIQTAIQTLKDNAERRQLATSEPASQVATIQNVEFSSPNINKTLKSLTIFSSLSMSGCESQAKEFVSRGPTATKDLQMLNEEKLLVCSHMLHLYREEDRVEFAEHIHNWQATFREILFGNGLLYHPLNLSIIETVVRELCSADGLDPTLAGALEQDPWQELRVCRYLCSSKDENYHSIGEKLFEKICLNRHPEDLQSEMIVTAKVIFKRKVENNQVGEAINLDDLTTSVSRLIQKLSRNFTAEKQMFLICGIYQIGALSSSNAYHKACLNVLCFYLKTILTGDLNDAQTRILTDLVKESFKEHSDSSLRKDQATLLLYSLCQTLNIFETKDKDKRLHYFFRQTILYNTIDIDSIFCSEQLKKICRAYVLDNFEKMNASFFVNLPRKLNKNKPYLFLLSLINFSRENPLLKYDLFKIIKAVSILNMKIPLSENSEAARTFKLTLTQVLPTYLTEDECRNKGELIELLSQLNIFSGEELETIKQLAKGEELPPGMLRIQGRQ
jgi:hypothetical protein